MSSEDSSEASVTEVETSDDTDVTVVADDADSGGVAAGFLLSVLFTLLVGLLVTASSTRGMGKRYASAYGAEVMDNSRLASWSAESFANSILFGLLGVFYDVTKSPPGECMNNSCN